MCCSYFLKNNLNQEFCDQRDQAAAAAAWVGEGPHPEHLRNIFRGQPPRHQALRLKAGLRQGPPPTAAAAGGGS